MKILSLYNIKGGVGKTTLTSLIAYNLSNQGKKILVIDADLQANTTQFLYKTNHMDGTIVNAIRDNATAKELILKAPNPKYPNVDLIPADIELCILGEYMAVQENKNKLIGIWFSKNIEILKKYDYIFVDLSPSIDLVSRNFLYICSSVIIPLSHGDLASIKGAELFNKLYSKDLEKLKIKGANVVTLLNYNKNYNRKVLSLFDKQLEVSKFSREHLLDTKISESTTIQQVPIMKTGLSELPSKYKNKKIEAQMNDLIEELKIKEML